jgi:hypothetical protein
MVAGAGKYRNWTGPNGKYETVGGRLREKWNNYTAFGVTTSVVRNNFELIVHYPEPPYGPNPPLTVNETVQWNPMPSLSEAGGFSANQELRAFSKLLTKIKGHEFNLGVETGQLRQTTGLLTSNLGKLGRAALALRRGDFSTAARQLGSSPRSTRLKSRDVSGRWLELQYGWLPLLSSSYEAMKAYEAITSGPRTHVYRTSAVEERLYNLSTSANYSARTKVKVGRKLQYEMYEELTVSRQLGLEDPLSIVWELTPWSFVIDWFLPFGSYLSNLNQIPKLKGRWLTTDFIKASNTKFSFKWELEKYQGVREIIKIPYVPNGTWNYTNMKRTYSNTPPSVPFPKFNLGGINSLKRLGNAIALAHSRFLR